jgi:trimeric autotransporter adhesin
MNKSFHSVWNASKQTYVAAAETVSAKGKPSSGVKVAAILGGLMAGLLTTSAHAQTAPPPTALPTGGQVSAGQARIDQSGAHMVIQQSTDRAAIHWQSFNVGKDAKVQFAQPHDSSVTLNRVLSNDPSQIFGQITANGQVILTNPSGVYFGKDARVDVGGLIATTHVLNDADFMAGHTRLERQGSSGQVVNEGELKASLGGYIALLAPEVRNQGAVIAQMGTVALAAGEAYDLKFDRNNRLTSLRVEASQLRALVDNRLAVQAPGGLVIISAQSLDRLVGGVVNNTGRIEATGMQQNGGRIVLSGSTRVQNAGSLDVSSALATGQGGSISLQGESIALQSSSRISATGHAGGGTVLVGGNWQGQTDPLLLSTEQSTTEAIMVRMDSGATIDASATHIGDGGKVVLWADIKNPSSHTTAQGTIIARGGAVGGNGGQVETSAFTVDTASGFVDAGAARGTGGLWLIDPSNDFTITQGVADGYLATLNTGTSVENYVEGEMTWDNGVTLNKSAGGDATLTLRTGGNADLRNILLDGATIRSTAGKLNLVLWTGTAGFSGRVALSNSSINTNGGHLWIGGGLMGHTWNGLNVGDGPARIWTVNRSGVSISNSTINTGAGSISMQGRSNVVVTTNGVRNHGILIDGGTTLTTTSGSITLIGDLNGKYNIGNGVRIGTPSVVQVAGNISITSDTGAINISGSGEDKAGGINGQRHALVLHSNVTGSIITVRTGSGAINLTGTAAFGAEGDFSNDNSGILLATNESTGSVNVVSTTGAITLRGENSQQANQNENAIRFSTVDTANNIRIGHDGSTAYSGNILIEGDSILQRYNQTGTGSLAIQTTGNLTIAPKTASFSALRAGDAGTLTFDDDWNFGTNLGGLTLGKNGNTLDLTLSRAITTAGPMNIYGGNITIDAGLTATGNNTISLTGTGNVTDGAAGFVSASNLVLLGGNVTLDNVTNSTDTLAASGVSGLTYVDSNALTIGTVGGTQGVSATGAVSIGTLTGDLSLAQNVATTHATATALVLNAGINTAVGTSTGGNLLLSGAPTVSVGSGGTAKLYSGSISGSTGLTALVGSGSGRFRYNSDEATTNFTTTLGTGLNAIYRERPSASGTISSETITYGAATPTFTLSAGALQNGDGSSAVTVLAPAYSTANKLKASDTAYSVSAPGLAGLGYNVGAVTNGTLTVNRKALGLAFSAANKVYDGSASAGISGVSLEGVITNDVVNLGIGDASFSDKNIGNSKTVTLTGIGLTSGNGNNDAANYSVPSGTSALANITAKALTITGQTAANKVYDATPKASVSGGQLVGVVGTEDVTLTQSGTFESRHVGTGINVIETNTLGGAAAGNYTLTQPTLTANITPKPLAVGLTSSDKIYDGTTTAEVNGTLGLQNAMSPGTGNSTDGKPYSGDAVLLGGLPNASFNSKDVATANTVTFAGLSLSGAQAGNYTLATTASHRISGAPLTVTAKNDAKLVTTADPLFSLGYSGFVNGETANTSGIFSTAPTVTVDRSNALTITNGTAASGVLASSGTEAAGTYAHALVPAVVAPNYVVTPIKGSYTIVPAEQLLVNVQSASAIYGATPVYTISSAKYLPAGSSTPVNVGDIQLNGHTVSVNDGSGTSATFHLAPLNPSLSSTAQTQVGTYQLTGTELSVTPSLNPNFKTLTVVGDLSVTPKALTPALHNVTKVYDGSSSAGASIGLTGVVTAGNLTDAVLATGVGTFASRNAGANTYIYNNLALVGNDASNYSMSNAPLTGKGTITAKPVTLTPKDVSRVYNGQTTYTPTAEDLSHLSGQLGVSGDTVSAVTLRFADKNTGTGKTLNASNPTVSDGNGGLNYAISMGPNTTSSMTRLHSVTWVGGATGNWFDPANWVGGAVPDLSNVAHVVIPNGVTIHFGNAVVAPAQSGTVHIDGLTGTGGNLLQSAGTLNVGTDGIVLASLTQSGGSFSGTGNITAASLVQTGGSTTLGGNLTVTQDFSQGPSGSVSVGGNTRITDTVGGMQLGHLTSTGTLSMTSTDGGIAQANGTTITAPSTSSFTATHGGAPADITLGNASNNFVGAVSLNGRHVTVVDANPLTLGNVTATGKLNAKAATDLTVNAMVKAETLELTATTGNIAQGTGSSITVATGPTHLSAGGNIILDGANDFNGAVNATGNNITLHGMNSLTLGKVTVVGHLHAQAAIDLAVNGAVKADTLDLTATTGHITQGAVSTMTVATGPTQLKAAGDIALNGANDFNGQVKASGNRVTLNDVNSLTLGDVTSAGKLDAKAATDLLVDGMVKTDNLELTAITGTLSQGPDSTLTVATGPTHLKAGGDISLNGANDFNGQVKASGNRVTLNDVNSLTLGDVTSAGKLDAQAATDLLIDGIVKVDTVDLTATAGNLSQSQDSTITVATGPSNFTAGGNIRLNMNGRNNFNGVVNGLAKDIALSDVDGLTLGHLKAKGDVILISEGTLNLGNTTVDGALTMDSGGGNVTQTGPLVVTGKLDVNAGSGNVDLSNKGNALLSRITVQAANAVVLGSLEIPARDLAAKLFGNSRVASLPGNTLSNAHTPQPLMLAMASPMLSPSAASSGSASTEQGHAGAGIRVELREVPSSSGMSEMVVVTLPKGMSTSGTGFSFEWPESVRSQAANNPNVRASLTDDSPLPAWLKFDAQTWRFEASAVPANALPLSLSLTFGTQRIGGMISERDQ